MAPNPNQIDISLSLLPGESETVISDLIETMRTVAAQMAQITGGNEFSAMSGPVPRAGVTGSTATHGTYVPPGTDASHPPGYEPEAKSKIWLPPQAAEERAAERTREKLGAKAAESDPSEQPTEDNASVAGQSEQTGHPVAEAIDESEKQGRIKRITNTLYPRKEPTPEQAERNKPGSFDWRQAKSTTDEMRDWMMTYGVFRNGKGGVSDEVQQLKTSFMPDNIERLGTELGGTQASSTSIAGIEGVLPGMPLVEAVRGLGPIQSVREFLGSDNARESAGYKGAQAEAKALWKGFKDPYITQSEARQVTHSTINKGWGADVAERDMDLYSRLRDPKKGGSTGMNAMSPAVMSDFLDQTRRGGGSVNDVVKALKAMPAAAKAAHMGLEEFVESSKVYAEELTKTGASFADAAMAGPSFAAATGMSPQQAGALRQNPLIQGKLYEQGYTPETEGLADSGTLAMAMSDSVMEMDEMYQNSFEPITKTLDSGTVVTNTSEEQRNAAIAPAVGLPNAGAVEKVKALREYTMKSAEATSEIDQYQNQAQDIEKDLTGAGRSEASRWMRTGKGAPEQASTRPKVMKQLKEAGVGREELAKVAEQKGATGFAGAARDALAKTTKEITEANGGDDESLNEKIAVSVELKMKGAAAQIFEDITKNTDVARNARRKRNRPGGGSFVFNNPDLKPPGKSIFPEVNSNLTGP